MIDEYFSKQILNYIYQHNLGEKYEVIPFQDVNLCEASTIQCKTVIENSGTADQLIEELIGKFHFVRLHVYAKINKLPTSLNKMGHLIQIDSSSMLFFYGRERELSKMQVIQNKRIKNNILIVGSPGTGKTSLVEAYARKYGIKNIFVVECARLISDTEYRGAFEQKIVELMKFAMAMNLVLFFDELHVLLQLGKAQGGISITDILKPYLLDENLCFIGATTIKEAQLLMEDEAFKRRFTSIVLTEPREEQLVAIKDMFEQNVVKQAPLFGKSQTLSLIQELRERLPSQHFPDKLVDFLDYMYAFYSVANKTEKYTDILEEYINDQRLEITDAKC